MLAAGNFPQHRTVCEFRRRHLAEFSELFVGVVQVAREMGLARFGKLSVDGTKVRANASKRKAMSYERMGKEAARLQAEIEALLTQAGMVEAEEDERWGEDLRGDELPEELQRREKRLAAIQAAKARLEAAQRGRDDERGREPGQDRNPRGGRPYKRAYGEPEPKAQSNFTDPESQPATRAEIIAGLKEQGFLTAEGQNIVPTDRGLALFGVLERADPALVDPGVTAELECLLDDVVTGKQEMMGAIDAVCDAARRIIGSLGDGAVAGEAVELEVSPGGENGGEQPPTAAMKKFAASIARRKGKQVFLGISAVFGFG